jgi:hypothetical protein
MEVREKWERRTPKRSKETFGGGVHYIDVVVLLVYTYN